MKSCFREKDRETHIITAEAQEQKYPWQGDHLSLINIVGPLSPKKQNKAKQTNKTLYGNSCCWGKKT
jgi:hypothetical protein